MSKYPLASWVKLGQTGSITWSTLEAKSAHTLQGLGVIDLACFVEGKAAYLEAVPLNGTAF